MSLQLGRFDLRVDGGEVGRLPSNKATVLLPHSVATTKYNSLGALQLVRSDLGQVVEKCFPVHEKIKLTENKEQEDPQRPLPTITTFLGSNSPSVGG